MNDRNRRRELARKHAAKSKAKNALEAAGGSTQEEPVPGWIYEGLREVEAKTSPGSLPVYVMKNEGAPQSEALAVVRLSELARVFKIGPAGELEDGQEGSA